MENASDALKIVFAVFVFIGALSIVFSQLSKIKETADIVLWASDKTNFLEPAREGSLSEKGREVGIEVLISTLNRQTKESTTIRVILDGKTYLFEPNRTEEDEEEIQKLIDRYIGSQIVFYEKTTEIVTDGSYAIGEDGTRVQTSPGGSKRIYITYTEKK